MTIAGRVRARRMLFVAAALSATVALGACGGVIGSFVSTREALSSAGYSHVSIGVTGDDDDVKVSATVDQDISDGEIREIAAIVWRDFHQRFGSLDITLHATGQTVTENIPFATLQTQIGPRDPAYNRSSIRHVIIKTGIVVLVIALVAVLLVVVGVVLVVRRRRRGRLDPAGSGRDPGGPGPGPGPGPWVPDRGGPPGGGAPSGPNGHGPSWGAPAPVSLPTPGPGSAPAGPREEADPWLPPPGSGPPAWS